MYQLAQVNIAKMLQPIDHPVMVDFVNNLDRINAVAENHIGYMWCFFEDYLNFIK